MFSIRLPLGNESPKEEQSAPSAEVPSTRLRVLVVDDNRAAADMLAKVVAMLGHEPRTAYDGEEGFEAAQSFLPDVVLMDIGMPKMNGYEAARAIRQLDWGATVMLVALTGWGQEEDRGRTSEAGFDHHLVKPAEPAALRTIFAASSSTRRS